jgi:hypothetical protein
MTRRRDLFAMGPWKLVQEVRGINEANSLSGTVAGWTGNRSPSMFCHMGIDA